MDAYAAGLIDGEGCISILCSKKRSVRYYGATVDVGMTKKALPILKRMKQEYGGTIIKRRNKTHRWEEAWSWRTHGAEAVACLQRIRPYLLMKKPQADTALALHAMIDLLPRNSNGTAKWSQEARLAASELKSLMLRLNAKGPEMMTEEGPEPFARLVDGVWVTTQPRLDGTSEPFSETWPKRGSMRNGACWEQTMSAPRIGASGCGFWPTARVSDGNGPGDHGMGGSDLRTVVARGGATRQTWATPDAAVMNLTADPEKHQARLNRLKEKYHNDGAGTPLAVQVRQTPTPTANRRSGLQSHGRNMILGSLNPEWTEWLMGWPRGWTDCERSATDKYLRQWLRRSRCWLRRLGC
jgi:hypothetical protein